MIRRLTLSALAILSLSIIVASCGESEETGIATIRTVADVTFNGEPIDTATYYSLNGFQYRFDIARYYVGGFSLRTGDETIDATDTYLMAAETGEASTVTFSDINVATGITDIDFFIGVDPATNSQSEQSFLDRSVEDPLSVKDPAMHWNWNTGYRFIRIDGEGLIPIDSLIPSDTVNIFEIDTIGVNPIVLDTVSTATEIVFDTINIGADTVRIEYHLGTDDLLTTFTADQGFNRLEAGEENRFLIRLDIANLLRDVDLRNPSDRETHTFDNRPLADQLREKLANGAVGYRLN
jgi:hypothetical protein